MVAIRRRCKILDNLIKKNPEKPIIKISKWEMDASRAFVKDTHTGLFEYDGHYFVVEDE